MQTIDAQPDTLLPGITIARITINSKPRIAAKKENIPVHDAIDNGTSEKSVIPSTE